MLFLIFLLLLAILAWLAVLPAWLALLVLLWLALGLILPALLPAHVVVAGLVAHLKHSFSTRRHRPGENAPDPQKFNDLASERAAWRRP